MSIYILMMTASVLSAIFACYYRRLVTITPLKLPFDRSRLYLLISFLIPFLVASLRIGIGADYYSYVYYFEQNTTIGSGQEIGYILLNRLIALFTSNPMVLFSICSLVTIGLFFITLYKHSSHLPLSIFLFFTMGIFYQSLSAIRQMIAVAICFYAYNYLAKKQLPIALLLVVVAALFHKSALILLIVYPLCRIKLKQSYFLMLTLGSVVSGILLYKPLMWFIDKRYHGYYSSAEFFNGTLFVYHLLLATSTLLLTFIVYNRFVKKDQSNYMLQNLVAYSLWFTIAMSLIPTMSRLLQYFIPFYLLIVPQILGSFVKTSTRRLLFAVYIIGYSIYILYFIKTSSLLVYPYEWIFSYPNIPLTSVLY